MLARFGNVIYWVFSTCAGGVALFNLYNYEDNKIIYGLEKAQSDLEIAIIGAAILWLIGRAAKYILTGK